MSAARWITSVIRREVMFSPRSAGETATHLITFSPIPAQATSLPAERTVTN